MNKATFLVMLFASLNVILAVSLEKRDSEHEHDRDHGHDHGHSGYQAPSVGYEDPSSSYSYETPSTAYGEPSYEPSYDSSYVAQLFPDLTPIIIGILAILGLSLMFPNNVRIDNVNGRKKRSVAEGKSVNSKHSV